MGHEVGGKLYLFPEEALFLLETVSMCKFYLVLHSYLTLLVEMLE